MIYSIHTAAGRWLSRRAEGTSHKDALARFLDEGYIEPGETVAVIRDGGLGQLTVRIFRVAQPAVVQPPLTVEEV